MCITCGCGDFTHRHRNSQALVWQDVRSAADDANISPTECAANIAAGVSAMTSAGKQADDPVGFTVVKSAPEQRYTLGVAYPANRADVSVAMDGFQDFVGPDALEKAAWSYLSKGGGVGLHHADGTDGSGTVVESYIYRGPDWEQPGGYVVKTGDWLLGVVWSEPSWDAIKAGKVNGFSPQGRARRRTPSAETLASLRS